MPTVNLTVTDEVVVTMAAANANYSGNNHPAVGHSGYPWNDVLGNGYIYYYDFYFVLPSNARINSVTITCGVSNKYTNNYNTNPLRFWDRTAYVLSNETSFSSGQTGYIQWSPTQGLTSGQPHYMRVELNTNGNVYYGVNEITYVTVTCDYTLLGGTWLNVGGTWKRVQPWLNVNGTWKRVTIWLNVNGTWKRCG